MHDGYLWLFSRDEAPAQVGSAGEHGWSCEETELHSASSDFSVPVAAGGCNSWKGGIFSSFSSASPSLPLLAFLMAPLMPPLLGGVAGLSTLMITSSELRTCIFAAGVVSI